MEKLTRLEAYKAMYEFLEFQELLTNAEEINILLSGMSMDDPDRENRTMISYYWDEWLEAIERATNNKESKHLTQLEAFKSMCEFLKNYNSMIPTPEVEYLISGMELLNPNDGKSTKDISYWLFWEDAIMRSKNNPDCGKIKWKNE